MTERATYKFVVKEGPEGRLFLALEPSGGRLSVLAHGLLSLDLASNTTMPDAEALARTLNQAVPSVSYTR